MKIITVEWLHYSDYNHFLRILVTTPLISESYSLIFTGDINHLLPNIDSNHMFYFKETEDMVRNLENLAYNEEFIQDPNKKKKFKLLIDNYIEQSFSNNIVNQFGNLSKILEDFLKL